MMTSPRPSSRLRFAAVLLFVSFGALSSCEKEGAVVEPSPRISFEQDVEAHRFVQGLRAALEQGRRPASSEVQLLKTIAKRFPEEPFVEQPMLSILPALKDWDGLSAYLESKARLSDELRMMLTRVYINQADYAGALRACQPMADRDPTHVEANSLAGRAHYFLEQNDEAARYYNRVWNSIVDQGSLVDLANRAMLHFDAGNSEQAQVLLQGALETHPDSISLHNAMARVLAAEGDQVGADRHSARVTELQAEISRVEQNAMLRAAQSLALNEAWAKRDFDGCQRLIHEFLPGADESFRNDLYGFLGSMYEAAGRKEEAAAAIERARQHAAKGERP